MQFLSGKKILVTGHTGFKGAWLAFMLQYLNADVLGISDEHPFTPKLLPILGNPCNTVEDFDIRDKERLTKAVTDFQPDLVFHFAAESLVNECFARPWDAFSTNLMGTVNVLEALRGLEKPVNCLIATTDKCYENNEEGKPFVETDRLGGKDPYSASKACAELAANAYAGSYFADTNKKIFTVRAGNVIGGGDWSKDRLVPDIMRSWSMESAVDIRNPLATRPWQHVFDCLNGYVRVLEYSERLDNGENFNFGPSKDGEKNVNQVLSELAKYFNYAEYNFDESILNAKAEAKFLSLNSAKSKEILNWETKLKFEETIEWTAKWYRFYYENQDSAEKLVDFSKSMIKEFLDK